MSYRKSLGFAAAIVIVVGAGIISHEFAQRSSYRFEKVSIPGVPNAGRISAHLYRGGQPTGPGFAALRALGVDTIVSFTLEGAGADAEASLVRALGMQYVHLPWSAYTLPDDNDVARFLQLTRSQRSRVVFVHCKAGSDRTGLMIASYRVLSDGWTPDQALDEMNAFGYEFVFHPQLRSFVLTHLAERAAAR